MTTMTTNEHRLRSLRLERGDARTELAQIAPKLKWCREWSEWAESQGIKGSALRIAKARARKLGALHGELQRTITTCNAQIADLTDLDG